MIKLFQVDAFTRQKFHGNPAAVCLLEEEKPDAWMKALALEMNLSETAFLLKKEGRYGLRWFTPAAEVKLCGHATLASAWVLFSEGLFPIDQEIRFSTLSGILTARLEKDAVVLNFPAFYEKQEIKKPALLTALGLENGRIWQVGDYLLVEVAGGEIVRNLQPDFLKMLELGNGELAVTSLSDDPDYDVILRFFAPILGIDEDPVTGSVHCAIAPFWMERLHKNSLRAYQASARGGSLVVDVQADRVELHGNAVTVFRAELDE